MLQLASLNPQQRAAVEYLRGPVLILAGAGTGKTRVITFRIAHMIASGISPGNVLAVTFTNKAAREMQERVAVLVPAKQGRREAESEVPVTICTFHSLCVRILRLHIEKLGYKRNFVIYDETEQLGVVKRILSHINIRNEKVEPSAILSGLSGLKNKGSDALRDRGEDSSALALAAHIRPRYEAALRACNAVDFDDLILLTLRLFREHPAALEACRQKYQYVMVDEYQDTNSSQFRLINDLTKIHRNLCVVGDDDQSIYGWRGAEISNLLDLEKHYSEVKVIKLEQNYRSTTTILTVANAVIKKNLVRRGKQLWSNKGQGPKVTLCTYKDEEEEAQNVAERIQTARLRDRATWSDFAILFRTNAQSRPLETALRKGDIPYRVVGAQSFFDRREIRDFVAYLKMLLNPNDDISLLRIANVPARGLSEATMERLLQASQERKCSVFQAMKNPALIAEFPARTRESVEGFVNFLEHTRAPLHSPSKSHAPQALQQWADHFLSGSGYIDDLRRSEKSHDMADTRVRNLSDLVAQMDGPSPKPGPLHDRLEDFLENVSLDNDRDKDEEKAGNQVTLITMHSCKGLEFPQVYIVGLEDGLLPFRREGECNLDEERRLFYVAITRAMHALSISHCAGRRKYGKPVVCRPSQFLADLPPDLVENESLKASAPVSKEDGRSMFSALLDSL